MAEYVDWIDSEWVEPRPWVKETLGAWRSFLMGDGLTYSPLPVREPIKGQKYSVGDTVIPQYTKAWVGQTPNWVTPLHFLDLLNFLNDFIEQLEAEQKKAFRKHNVTTCEELAAVAPGEGQLCADLQRWRVRLSEYSMAVGAVPEADQYDRTKTLWSVTAPLFLGWYGGKTGKEIPLVAGGFPAGFDPALRHPPDIGTPYSLANQFGIAQAWSKERKDKVLGEMLDPGKGNKSSKDFGIAPWLIGGALALGVLWWVFGTPRDLKRED